MKKLGELEIYRLSLDLSQEAWEIYKQIPKPMQFDIGRQFLRAIDSIGANIAEGYGRYHYRDSLNFYYNSRGSLWESKHWLILLYRRNFINKQQYDTFLKSMEVLGIQLNSFIKRLKNAGK